jgi:hypothetical protein
MGLYPEGFAAIHRAIHAALDEHERQRLQLEASSRERAEAE